MKNAEPIQREAMWSLGDWQRAPWLLSAKDVMSATGCTKHDLCKLREAGLLTPHLPTSHKPKYFKSQVMEVFRVAVAT